MAKFADIYINFILLALILVGAMSFIVSLQSENDVSTLTDDENYGSIINSSFINIEREVIDAQSTTNDSLNAFQSEIPKRSFGSLIVFSVVGIVTTFTKIITGVYNVLIVLPAQILQVPPIFMSAIATLLGVMFALTAWRVYRAGE